MTTESGQDHWAAWLAERRHGGDPEHLRRQLEFLAPIRDQVIANAALAPGHHVLDVGCGDGLIAFAAAAAVGPAGQVIFSDVSTDLLDRSREQATRRGLLNCRFVQAPARDLSPIPDQTVDAVTLRSGWSTSRTRPPPSPSSTGCCGPAVACHCSNRSTVSPFPSPRTASTATTSGPSSMSRPK